MVSVVIGGDEDLPQDVVPRLAVRNLRVEVGFRVLDKVYECLPVMQELLDRLLPRGAVGLLACLRLVLVRPVEVLVLRIDDVVEDVPLGNADVLQQMPERAIHVRWDGVVVLLGEVRNGVLERHVRLPLREQVNKVLPELCVGGHALSPV